MVAGLLATLVACAALALVGAHLGLAWSLVPRAMAALMSDSEGFLSHVLAEGLRSLQTRPLSIPWASPAVRLGAMLAGILPAIVYVAVIMAKTRNDRAGEESGSSRWATTAEIRRFATTNNPSPDNLILLSEHAALPSAPPSSRPPAAASTSFSPPSRPRAPRPSLVPRARTSPSSAAREAARLATT